MRCREFSPQTSLSGSRLETSANSLRTRNFASLRNSAIVVSSGPKVSREVEMPTLATRSARVCRQCRRRWSAPSRSRVVCRERVLDGSKVGRCADLSRSASIAGSVGCDGDAFLLAGIGDRQTPWPAASPRFQRRSSNSEPRCMVQRLSQITRSWTRQRCV